MFGAQSRTEAPPSRSSDAQSVELIRSRLKDQYQRIRSVAIEYEQTWTPDASSRIVQKSREQRDRNLAERMKKATPNERALLEQLQKRKLTESHTAYRLVDAFPSIRLEAKTRHLLADGTAQEETSIRALHNKTYVEIHPDLKYAYTGRFRNLNTFGNLPTNALGFRVPFSVNQPLWALLVPGRTSLLAQGDLSGKAVVLQCGPDLPDDRRPAGFKQAGYARIWLSADMSSLPVKIEYHPDGRVFDPDNTDITKMAVIHTVTLSEFADTKDEQGSGYIKFPRHITYRDAAGTTNWDLTSARINASIRPGEFAPEIPDGYRISQSGSTPKVFLKGGPAEQARAVARTTSRAREMLASLPVPAEASGTKVHDYLLFAVVALLVACGFFLLVRRLPNVQMFAFQRHNRRM